MIMALYCFCTHCKFHTQKGPFCGEDKCQIKIGMTLKNGVEIVSYKDNDTFEVIAHGHPLVVKREVLAEHL
jgi:hypothetical protein